MKRPNKKALAEALRNRVDQELLTLRESQQAAQDGAIHEEARQEDPKDTRAIEAQYVARGLAERVEDLQKTVAVLAHMRLDAFGPEDPIDLSALVGLKDGEVEKTYFLVPVAGGETLDMQGRSVQTLTPGSPLGLALSGKLVDDDIELDLPGRRILATVDWVR
jgi:transcription elongation GreA/GreB family factor